MRPAGAHPTNDIAIEFEIRPKCKCVKLEQCNFWSNSTEIPLVGRGPNEPDNISGMFVRSYWILIGGVDHNNVLQKKSTMQ